MIVKNATDVIICGHTGHHQQIRQF